MFVFVGLQTMTRREIVFLLGLSAMLFAARWALAAHLELMPDEALYALLAERAPLSWGSFPPGVLLLGRAGMALGGRNEVALRFFSILLTTGALWPFYLLARDFSASTGARYATLCFALVPMFGFFGATLTPDGPQVFIWCCLLLFAWRALQTSALRWWLLTGFMAGAGLWIKYPLALFWPSLLLALWLRRDLKAHARGVLMAALACCIVVMPPLLRQTSSGEAALRYQLVERQSAQLPHLRDVTFWYGAHALYVSPLLYVACLAALWWCAKHAKLDQRAAFCFAFAIVTWALFAIMTACTRRELHREHWDALAYPPLILALPLMARDFTMAARRFSVAVPVAAALCFALMLLEGVGQVPSRALGKGPLFWHLMGWRAMARDVDRRLEPLPPQTLVVGESFVNGAQYWFYGRHPERARCLDAAYNQRFGVASAMRQVGFIWPQRGEKRQVALSVGGPYSTPAELAKWRSDAMLLGRLQTAPPLVVPWPSISRKPLKRFGFFLIFPVSLVSMKKPVILSNVLRKQDNLQRRNHHERAEKGAAPRGTAR